MQSSILVFNRESLGQITEGPLLKSITESNYETLCKQYGLETSLIEPALSHLEVIGANNDVSPFFVVKYGDSPSQMFVVQQWDASAGGGKKFLHEMIEGIALEPLRARLLDTAWLVEIVLDTVQLQDMGLLLAYEIARWAAERGKGLVLGMGGAWYRLNRHNAFMLIENDPL